MVLHATSIASTHRLLSIGNLRMIPADSGTYIFLSGIIRVVPIEIMVGSNAVFGPLWGKLKDEEKGMDSTFHMLSQETVEEYFPLLVPSGIGT